MVAIVLFLFCFISSAFGADAPGYDFIRGHIDTSIPFKLYKNLIVIPVTLNDTLRLNLILDTGTRSILLYGKRFKKLSNFVNETKLKVVGWGSADAIEVRRAFPNTISIGDVRGEQLCAAVVDHRKLFADSPTIDGIIGYEIFARFSVEIDYLRQKIFLYDKIHHRDTRDFLSLPLVVNGSRPEIISNIELETGKKIQLNLLVDTGSSLGLTIFSKTIDEVINYGIDREIGIGLTGSIWGYSIRLKSLSLGTLFISNLLSNLVHVKEHPDLQFTTAGSLGAGFLKDYLIIFDYPTNRLFVKKNLKSRGGR
jgi:hypothetical protein